MTIDLPLTAWMTKSPTHVRAGSAPLRIERVFESVSPRDGVQPLHWARVTNGQGKPLLEVGKHHVFPREQPTEAFVRRRMRSRPVSEENSATTLVNVKSVRLIMLHIRLLRSWWNLSITPIPRGQYAVE